MKKKTLLFDFDGVVVDTEPQYTILWDRLGKKYLNADNFASRIKGQTIDYVWEKYFSTKGVDYNMIKKESNNFEISIEYNYIKGFKNFLRSIYPDFNTAIVTSSTKLKMIKPFHDLPELIIFFDKTFTSEDFIKSKPDPECYISAMKYFNSDKNDTIVFEDSFSGLESARRSGAKVVGLATGSSVEEIKKYADIVIKNFKNFDVKQITEYSKQ